MKNLIVYILPIENFSTILKKLLLSVLFGGRNGDNGYSENIVNSIGEVGGDLSSDDKRP